MPRLGSKVLKAHSKPNMTQRDGYEFTDADGPSSRERSGVEQYGHETRVGRNVDPLICGRQPIAK